MIEHLVQAVLRSDPAAPTGSLDARARFFLRLRVELAGAVLLSVAVPALLRNGMQFGMLFAAQDQKLNLGILLALLAGYFMHRRVTDFPGIRASAYILPSFSLSFGVVIAIFFFGRIDYSRAAFLLSFVLAVVWALGYDLARRRLHPTHLGIVPVGEVEMLRTLDGVVWHPIASPFGETSRLDGIVADLRADMSDEWERFIAAKALAGTPVYHVKQIRESLTGRVEIEHLSENTLGSLNPNQAYLKIKQFADWLIAAFLLVGLAPVLALVAMAIRLDSPGPALYVQSRVGYRGKLFRMLKFRTMQHDAAFADNSGEGSSRSAAMTLQNDERITRLGRVLRRTRIDELPQLVNILRGEMSLIGPRPEALVLSEWYSQKVPYYSYRHIVRPGITGWAQVNQGHVAEVEAVYRKLNYDFYYIRNFSAWLDMLILFRTAYTVVSGFGAR